MAVSTKACGAGMGAEGVGAGIGRGGESGQGPRIVVLRWARMEVGRERPYMTPLLTTKAKCSAARPRLLVISAVVGLYGVCGDGVRGT
jgi:hypothetical protein